MTLFSMRFRTATLQVHGDAAAEGGGGQTNVTTSRKECTLSHVAFVEVHYVGLLQYRLVSVRVIGHDHVRGGGRAVIYAKFQVIFTFGRYTVIFDDLLKNFLVRFPSCVHGVFVIKLVCNTGLGIGVGTGGARGG